MTLMVIQINISMINFITFTCILYYMNTFIRMGGRVGHTHVNVKVKKPNKMFVGLGIHVQWNFKASFGQN